MTQLNFFPAGEETPGHDGYPSPVRDIQDIRYQNFLFLLQEVEEDLGKPRGAAAALATRTGVKASFISMLVNQALHSETGKRRQIGDDTAKKLEEGMGKPENWLDVDRQQARNHKEAQALDLLRQLSASQQEVVIRMMDELLGRGGREPKSPPTPPAPTPGTRPNA